ncbi:MAG: nitroreductase family protein, partial [Bacteroidales bacterium]
CDLVIVPCISGGEKRFEGCVPLDMSACTENILLEAQTLGLGAVWLGIYPEQDRIEAVAKVIGAEDGCIPFALITVGHPKEMLEPRSSKRFDMSRVRWV